MNHVLRLDIEVWAGNDVALGREELWLPKKPTLPLPPLGVYPFEIPALRVTIRKIVKITLSLMLKGTITVYAPGSARVP